MIGYSDTSSTFHESAFIFRRYVETIGIILVQTGIPFISRFFTKRSHTLFWTWRTSKMKTWFQLVFQTIKVFILFTGCTILFYYGIMWVNEEYQDYHRYDEPNGTAVKVSASVDAEKSTWFDRIVLFYLNGE